MSAPILAFEGVSQWYGSVSALKSVTLEIGPGIVGLVGPNGAGKTTFLRLATGLMAPSRGRVTVLGETVFRNARLTSRIGYAPEADAHYEFLTGRAFLLMLLGLSGFARSDASRLSQEALEKVALGDVADRKVHTYSRGMRQRLKIAQAIAHRPAILFLDEPMSGTDPIQRKRLKTTFRELAREGTSILLSSHVLHEIEALTPDFVLLSQGRVVAQGDVHEIRTLIDRHPASVVVTTSEPRRLARALCELETVRTVEIGERHVRALTHQPQRFYGELPGLILDSGVEVTRIESPDDNLESVFRYLVQP